MGETRRGPLDGYRILELTTTVSGPMAAMTLADQGAEVLKIEPPFTGDTARFLGPARNGMAAMFATVNRNKKSVCLDLKVDEERAIFSISSELPMRSSRTTVPVSSIAWGSATKPLSSIRPELVYASITGYGTGPYENRRVFDPLIQATAGTAAAQGGDDPENVRMIIFDKVTALTTAQAITAALLERGRTGRGQYLPITMLESALSYQWPDVMWSRTYVGDGVSSGPGELADWFPTFQAADGPVSIILVSDGAIELFSIWREASLHTDPRFATPALREANIDELVAEVNALIADVPVAEVCATLDAFGVPVARVNTLDEVFDDEQVRHLGAIIETEHPDGGPMRIARPPVPFGGVRETAETFPAKHAPRLGEDSAAVLGEVGVDGETIARLLARDAENAAAVHAMIEARAAAEAASTDD